MTATVTTITDVIDTLLGTDAALAAAPLRAARPVTRAEAQASHDALFTADSFGATLVEKLVVAVFVARLHGDEAAADLYAVLLAHAGGDASFATSTREAAAAAAGAGPYGDFPSHALAAFDHDGPEFAAPRTLIETVGTHLAAALEHAHFLVFHPRDAVSQRLSALRAAGWSEDGIVTLSQEVAFLSFQLRVAAGLTALAGAPGAPATPVAAVSPSKPRLSSAPESDDVPANRPQVFTSAELGWSPWAEPVAETELTDEQWDALIDRPRGKSPYFRLLARDPGILKHRTLTDKDIFYNADGGLPRAERELSAAAVSRFNGCIYCASVHSRFASHYSKRDDDVQRLLADGVDAEQDPRWRAIVDASVALTRTPIAFGTDEVDALRVAGLADDEIADLVHSAAFFNWANRLMLSLGEPELPAPSSTAR